MVTLNEKTKRLFYQYLSIYHGGGPVTNLHESEELLDFLLPVLYFYKNFWTK